jgi:KaiC protein
VGLPDVGRPTARRGPLGNILPRQALGQGPKIVTSGACRRRWGQLPRLGAGRARRTRTPCRPARGMSPSGSRRGSRDSTTSFTGYFVGSTALVVCVSGVGETVMGLRFLADGARRGEPGLMVTLDETQTRMIRDAATIGIDQPDCEDAGSTKKRWLLVNAKLKRVFQP